jgi:hypothetical protein
MALCPPEFDGELSGWPWPRSSPGPGPGSLGAAVSGEPAGSVASTVSPGALDPEGSSLPGATSAAEEVIEPGYAGRPW